MTHTSRDSRTQQGVSTSATSIGLFSSMHRRTRTSSCTGDPPLQPPLPPPPPPLPHPPSPIHIYYARTLLVPCTSTLGRQRVTRHSQGWSGSAHGAQRLQVLHWHHWHHNLCSRAVNSLLLLSREEDAYIEFLRLRNVSIAEAPPALIPPLALTAGDVMQRLRCKGPSAPRFTACLPHRFIPRRSRATQGSRRV
jgi:hypothetical protein